MIHRARFTGALHYWQRLQPVLFRAFFTTARVVRSSGISTKTDPFSFDSLFLSSSHFPLIRSFSLCLSTKTDPFSFYSLAQSSLRVFMFLLLYSFYSHHHSCRSQQQAY